VFTERGFNIIREFPFREGAVAFEVDGWDPEARIGFEYLTREAGDHDDLTRIEFEKLTEAMRRGELHIFVIDEGEIENEEELAAAGHAFIDEVTLTRARDITTRGTRPTPPPRPLPSLPPMPIEPQVDDDGAPSSALSPRVVEAAARAARVFAESRVVATQPTTIETATVAKPRATPATVKKRATTVPVKKKAAKKASKKTVAKKASKKKTKATKKASKKKTKATKKASKKKTKATKKAPKKKTAKKATARKKATRVKATKAKRATQKKKSSKKPTKSRGTRR
jgi:hypothetical protein